MAGPLREGEYVRVPIANGELEGNVEVPAAAAGVVLFAHGSGSSRFSPRNRRVARTLQQGRLATLLIDLLTPAEEEVDVQTAQLRFDIGLLAGRVLAATDWLRQDRRTAGFRIGYFGASTGAAAALVAAAERLGECGAVVSRGGRPDLAGEALEKVRAPTLLIVGGDDWPVIRLNREAFKKLHCERRFEIIPGATHLFEEPGAIERVAELAREWFQLHLAGRTFE